MELKQLTDEDPKYGGGSLNRTFYGIETPVRLTMRSSFICLNRTFYGIETVVNSFHHIGVRSLNRTFYGIET